MSNKTCFILRMPPPYGGGEIVSQLLYYGLSNEYGFYFIKREDHSKSKQQNISFGSYLHGIKYVWGIILHIRNVNPEKIFIGLPKTFGAFLRNAIIIYYCNFKGVIVYAELHGMSFPFLKNPYCAAIFKNVINKVCKIRVLSNSIKDYLLQNGYKNKIEVIDNAIELPKFLKQTHHPVSQAIINILYLGLISESKGFSRLIEIIRLLHMKNIYGLKINIIGEWHSEDFKSQSLNKIYNLGLSNFFNFHGALYDESKWSKMYENDILIHLTKFDGQPLSIIECMALGIPAISTKVGAIPEMITNNVNGFLVEQDEEIVNVIENIQNHKIELTSIKTNCVKTYNNRFSPNVLYEKMRYFIES